MKENNERIFNRKAYSLLKEWKERSKGRTALMVEGARRVGKTTLVKEFAKREYCTHIVIDFSEDNKEIKSLFKNLNNLDRFFRGLQIQTDTQFKERDTLIIFDEVQKFPRAREAIKTLVKDGKYDYIETGSLISIKKNVKNIIIPSEEEIVKLHPLDFEEFLEANDIHTFRLLEKELEEKRPLSESVHKHMIDLYNEYLAVGGMPQAVKAFVEGESFQEIDKIKRDIIKLYVDDFYKIDISGHLGLYFSSIPSELSRQSSRFRLKGKSVSREMKRISEMINSQTVQRCVHVNDPHIGMPITEDYETFKLYLEDTGLFITLCFYDKEVSDNLIYKELVNGKLPANLGYVYENAVAQALTALRFKLYYHTFKKDLKHDYEIDFLISMKNKICPIEVKSSRTSSHKSLDSFMKKHKSQIYQSIIVSTKNLKEENGVLYLPIYMVGLLDKI